ncbi:MAG: hypothetical protein KIT81_03405 [Alphaproteobacteria bacterium]|nr:hypothetical protein [Alphaproteobacteria bacterium]
MLATLGERLEVVERDLEPGYVVLQREDGLAHLLAHVASRLLPPFGLFHSRRSLSWAAFAQASGLRWRGELKTGTYTCGLLPLAGLLSAALPTTGRSTGLRDPGKKSAAV